MQFAENDVQHGAAREAERKRQHGGTERAEKIPQHRAENGGRARDGREEGRFYLFHAARDERHRHRHTLGDVVQSYNYCHRKTAHAPR